MSCEYEPWATKFVMAEAIENQAAQDLNDPDCPKPPAVGDQLANLPMQPHEDNESIEDEVYYPDPATGELVILHN
jgi:hypothetical protein